MGAGWLRLDTDFYRDEKFRAMASIKGKAKAYDAVRLYCLCHQKYGVLDITDLITRAWVLDELGMNEKQLEQFLDDCAECRIISSELLAMGKVTSERLSEEGQKRRDAEDRKRLGGIKSGEIRRKKATNIE